VVNSRYASVEVPDKKREALIQGNQLRGHLESMVLSVLEHEEAHGFEVLRRLEQTGCGALKLREGSLYPALYRLEKQGMVKARWEEGESARRGPRRRLYRITPKGRRLLRTGREEWNVFASVIGRIVAGPIARTAT
jgi:PadR family transcriptional regulator PadR